MRSKTGWTASRSTDSSCGSARTHRRRGQSSGALLLPLYDELTLSYPVINFPQAAGHPHTPGEDLFVGSVIIAETNVGTWRRTVQGRKMIMEIALAPGVARRSGALVEAAASKLATFLGKELELTITG